MNTADIPNRIPFEKRPELINLLNSFDRDRSPEAGPCLWYLATVYTKHPDGPLTAWCQACEAAAELMKMGFNIFSPIAHSHPIAQFGELDHFDHEMWMKQDRPLMDAATGMIVVRMPNWQESEGIAEEIQVFTEAGKPIIYVDP